MKRIVCICGGGSQGHISAGVIGNNPNYAVNILTRRPDQWSHHFVTKDLSNKEYHADLVTISSDPGDVIPQSNIILICLPGYAIKAQLEKIKPYITENHIIGSVFGGSGFFIAAQQVFGPTIKAFALQRVPFTGRPIEYGKSARLKGYKPYLKVATLNLQHKLEAIASMIQEWYHTPVFTLSHWLEATLSNSNPILHPCRLFVLFKNWTPDTIYSDIPFLYDKDWDDESSELWVACDQELEQIIANLPINRTEIPTVLEYYGCHNTQELTKKMQSIVPFKGVQPHMIKVEGGYILDASHRYFTEDIPYGLVLIKSFAERVSVVTPNIDKVLYWAQNVMGKEYLVEGKLIGRDMSDIGSNTNIQW